MKIQYQLASGSWKDCGPREQEFISLAVEKSIEITNRIGAEKLHKFDQHLAAVVDTQTAKNILESGKTLKTGTDWYSEIRAKPAPSPEPANNVCLQLICKSCGQAGHRGSYPFSTLPDSGRCDDCA